MSLSSLLTYPPIRYTIRQYFTLHGQGDYLNELALDSAELWDALRESHPNFVIPKDRDLTVSEYAPENVELLKTLFHECDVIRRFDLFGDQWGEYANKPAQVVILNRLDPLFSNEQWTDAFDKMGKAGVVQIVYIPAWILSVKFYLQAHKRHLRYRRSNTPTVFTGWARTRQVQHRFWEKHYEHTEHALAGLQGFFLTKRA